MGIVKRDLPKGIRREGPGRDAKYPFTMMEVGDCLEIPLYEWDDHALARRNLSSAWRSWRVRSGHKDWTTRVTVEPKAEGEKDMVLRAYRIQ